MTPDRDRRNGNAKGERAKESKRGGTAGAREGGRRLWITAPRGGLREDGTFPTVPPCVSRSRTAALLRHRPFVRASVKGSTECPKGSVLVRHGVCPMLSVVAMGMLLIGRRADRRHGSRGATPTIARRPHPYRGPTATPCRPQYHPHTMQLACMYVPADARARARTRENPHDCGLSRVCTNTRAYTGTSAHTRSPNCPLYPI